MPTRPALPASTSGRATPRSATASGRRPGLQRLAHARPDPAAAGRPVHDTSAGRSRPPPSRSCGSAVSGTTGGADGTAEPAHLPARGRRSRRGRRHRRRGRGGGRGFGGDRAAYEAALAELDLSLTVGPAADRRPAAAAGLRGDRAGPLPRRLAVGTTERRQRTLLRTTICLGRRAARPGLTDVAVRVPMLAVRDASISIAADRKRVKRGSRSRSRARSAASARPRSSRSSPVAPPRARTRDSGRCVSGPTLPWSFQVRPTAQTTYRAVSKSAASGPIVVRVKR